MPHSRKPENVKINSILDVVAKNLEEANKADSLVREIDLRYTRLFKFMTPAEKENWHYIKQSIAWRLLLAISRVVESSGRGVERQNIYKLKHVLINADQSLFTDKGKVENSISELVKKINQPIVKKIKDSRDSFIAHSLGNNFKPNLTISELSSYLADIDWLVDAIHEGVNGYHSRIIRSFTKDKKAIKEWGIKALPLKRRTQEVEFGSDGGI